jgi:hypothetical protein
MAKKMTLKRKKEVSEMADKILGKAFRGSDGTIRWFLRHSDRGYFSCLWLDESDDVWMPGGIYQIKDLPLGEEVPAPQPGEKYKNCGATGLVSEMTA